MTELGPKASHLEIQVDFIGYRDDRIYTDPRDDRRSAEQIKKRGPDEIGIRIHIAHTINLGGHYEH